MKENHENFSWFFIIGVPINREIYGVSFAVPTN